MKTSDVQKMNDVLTGPSQLATSVSNRLHCRDQRLQKLFTIAVTSGHDFLAPVFALLA